MWRLMLSRAKTAASCAACSACFSSSSPNPPCPKTKTQKSETFTVRNREAHRQQSRPFTVNSCASQPGPSPITETVPRPSAETSTSPRPNRDFHRYQERQPMQTFTVTGTLPPSTSRSASQQQRRAQPMRGKSAAHRDNRRKWGTPQSKKKEPPHYTRATVGNMRWRRGAGEFRGWGLGFRWGGTGPSGS